VMRFRVSDHRGGCREIFTIGPVGHP
jgi:hypothetical protein